MRGRGPSALILLCLAADCSSDPAGRPEVPDAAEGGEGGSHADASRAADTSRATDTAPVADAVGAMTDGGSNLGFVGTWVYTSGQEEIACMGKPPQANDLTGVTLVLAAGTTAPLVISGDTCNLAFDVSGSVATARPSQMCKLTDTGSTLTYTVKSYTLTLANVMLVEMSAWMIDFMDPMGNLSCGYTTKGTLQRAQ
jgi:hypothetical protein